MITEVFPSLQHNRNSNCDDYINWSPGIYWHEWSFIYQLNKPLQLLISRSHDNFSLCSGTHTHTIDKFSNFCLFTVVYHYVSHITPHTHACTCTHYTYNTYAYIHTTHTHAHTHTHIYTCTLHTRMHAHAHTHARARTIMIYTYKKMYTSFLGLRSPITKM